MFANIFTAISSSTAITFALLYLMSLLISIQPGAVVEPRETWNVPWVRLPPPVDPPDTIEPKPKKDFIEPPTPPASDAPSDSGEGTTVRVPVSPPPPVTGYRGPDAIAVDGPPVSLVRPHPTYPTRQQQLGIEGYVIVQFDILPSGFVDNISVVESSDPVFERPALRAAKKFRFKPRVVDGVPVETPGMRNIFRFRMEPE